MLEDFAGRYPYFLTAALLVLGLYGMLAKRNLFKQVIGMTIFQTAIFLFFIQGAAKWGGTVPVLDPARGTDPAQYVNPLPHVLILTAIVVGVANTGVALALLYTIHRRFGTLDEARILEKAKGEH
ncbi:MAG: cation:proton antiporter subunit C [Dehalococcoidia bacterium]|nr:cation:proton antiporter subunit C [Dehalococcoidia bacterium]MDW8119794.1 cation:proton antiporter subunit C [Chloroflexota bacterium]